jgi:hypothetical protein
MYRYHFYEGLVRFAVAKYKNTGKANTSSEALKMLFENDLFSREGSTTSWMDVR